MKSRPLNEGAVFGVFGAVKWVIIGSIILGVVLLAYSIYSGMMEWAGDNCDAGQSIAACIAEDASINLVSVAWDALAGSVAGLFKGGMSIGKKNQKYNIFSNARSIWRHYFGGGG